MDLRICFMGVIAHLTGQRELTLRFDEAPTLRHLLHELEDRFGPEFGSRLFRSATPPRLLQMCTRIFVNGQLVDDAALDAPVSSAADDASSTEVLVYLLPAACGG